MRIKYKLKEVVVILDDFKTELKDEHISYSHHLFTVVTLEPSLIKTGEKVVSKTCILLIFLSKKTRNPCFCVTLQNQAFHEPAPQSLK